MAIGNTVEATIGASLSPTFAKSFKQAETQAKGLGAAVDRLSSKAAAAKGVQELKGSVDRASSSLKSAESRLQSINRRIESGEKQTDELVNAWVQAEERVDRARKSLDKLQRKLGEAERETKKFDNTTDGVTRSQQALQAQLQKTARIQERYNKQMARANALQDRAGKLGMAAAGTAAAGYAMARTVAAPIKTGMAFEAAASDVLSIANQKGQFETLEVAQKALVDRVKQLGASTSFTGAEVAAGAKYLTMAGFDISKTIEALPATLSLARAGGLDLGQTADIVSNIMTPFNIGAERTAEVADVMAAVITTSNTDIAMLGNTMKYVAPAASALGLSMEEAAAMAGLLGNSGIQSSMAGTTMRAMFQRLTKPVGNAQKVLDELGMTLQDTEGNLRSPVALLGEFGEAMSNKGWGTAQQLGAISEVFGAEAMAGAKTIMDAAKANGQSTSAALHDYIRQVQAAAGSGIAGDIAAKQLDNLQGDLTILGSAVDGAFVAMYDTIKPILRSIVRGITTVVGGINNWINEHPFLTKVIMLTAVAVTTLTIGAATLLGIMSLATFGAALWTKANAALGLAMGVTTKRIGVMNVLTFKANALAVATSARLKSVTMWYAVTNARLKTQIPLIWNTTRAWAAQNLTLTAVSARMTAVAASSLLMAGGLKKGAVGAAASTLVMGKGMLTGLKTVGLAFLTPIASLKALGAAATAFMVSNPLGWIIGAIAATAFMIYKYWQPIKAFAGGVWKGVADAFTPVKEAAAPLMPIFTAIGNAVSWATDKIFGFLAPADVSAETLNKMEKAGYALGRVIGLLIKPLEWLMQAMGWVVDKINGAIGMAVKAGGWLKDAWNWAFGDDEEQSTTLQPVAKSEDVVTPNGTQYTRQGNLLTPRFQQGMDEATTGRQALPEERKMAVNESPYAAMTRDRALAATGSSNQSYVYRTQQIDKVEISVSGNNDPTATADAIMMRINEETARRERELND